MFARYILVLVTKHHKYSQGIFSGVVLFLHIHEVSSQSNVAESEKMGCVVAYVSLCTNIMILAVVILNGTAHIKLAFMSYLASES